MLRNRFPESPPASGEGRPKSGIPSCFLRPAFPLNTRLVATLYPCDRGAPQQPAKDFLAMVDSILIALETLEPGRKKLIAPLI
jgi:hypothetical protein